jgi:hypothetical protein
MKKLAIRFIVSLGGDVPYQAMEKDKKGNFVYHDFEAIQALRLIGAEYATPKDIKEYEKLLGEIETLEAEKLAKDNLAKDIENLDELKAKRDSLTSELEEIEESIQTVEVALGQREPDDAEEVAKNALIATFKNDKNIVDELSAGDLKILCEAFDVSYTNVADAKTALKIVTIG